MFLVMSYFLRPDIQCFVKVPLPPSFAFYYLSNHKLHFTNLTQKLKENVKWHTIFYANNDPIFLKIIIYSEPLLFSVEYLRIIMWNITPTYL